MVSVEDIKYGPLTLIEQEKLRLKIGDVLLIRSNGSAALVGKTALVAEDALGCSFAGYLVRIRLRNKIIDPEYFQMVMKTPHIRESIETPIRTTSGVKNINSTEISNLKIPLPPLAQQHAIVRKIRELATVCAQLTERLAAASQVQQEFANAVVEKASTAGPI
ncbi:restriction endonuclease subunit S [Rugamonas sp.]|uniref:restriction endonuclease subunit S n=1 Tax=Rugamonas sp. TaxID=1926287 RepID=UPI0025DB3883|nr:restriction endonuclease subunit S [Rugamonas sp.]